MTVYIPHHNGKIDTSDATRYGDLRVIFRREVFPDDVDDQIPVLIRRAQDSMADFDPEVDYLALVGSPLYVSLCSFILGNSHSFIRVLRFDRMERAYYEIDLEVHALDVV